MADVAAWVAQIRAAIYGEQVRESIAKSIEAMNEDNIETLENYNDTIADVEAATEAANDAAGAATDIKDEVEAKLEHGDFIGATGPQGEAATVAVGSVTTGQPGTAVQVVNSGTNTDAVLDFTIPQGATGNVDNMDTVAITFEPDTTDQNIASGMTLSGLFGRLQGLIGSIRTTLSARDESTLTSAPSISSSDYVRLVESDGDMYKKLVSDVADYILRTYAPSTSGPTSGSVMEKINSLNGNIEKLNGAAIPSNANLNSYNTVGEYYAPSNAIASSLTNRPSDLTVAFSMLVLNKGGTNIQAIFTNGGNIYLRGQISTGWQGWVKFSGSSI